MTELFRPLPVKHFSHLEKKKDSEEQSYWKNFEFPTIIKEYSAINHLDISPISPYDILATSSSKAQVITPYTNEVKKISKRAETSVYGARFRSDGKLAVIGGYSGVVEVVDAGGRSTLRALTGHKRAVKVCAFSKEHTKLFSASDDRKVKYWDVPAGKVIHTLTGHEDHIRCGCVNETVHEQFLTGSYDHMAKMWDFRSQSPVFCVDHGAPVECVLMHKNGLFCYTAGGNYIKVWDVLAGGKFLKQFSNQRKTVTTMCFNGDNTRLLCASLDRFVKIHDVTEDYNVVAGVRYHSPILSMALSKDDNHLVVGTADGGIYIKNRRKPKAVDGSPKVKKRFLRMNGSYATVITNEGKPAKHDLVVKDQAVYKESKVDFHLRKFEYDKAFDAVMKAPIPQRVSLVVELARRNGWKAALDNRDENWLTPVMAFLADNVTHPQYGKTLIPFAEYILDAYAPLMLESKRFEKMVKQLSKRIRKTLHSHDVMMQSLGALEQIFSIAMTAQQDAPHQASDNTSNTDQLDETSLIAKISEECGNTVSSSSVADISDVEETSLTLVNDDVTVLANRNATSRQSDHDNVEVDFSIDDSQTQIMIE